MHCLLRITAESTHIPPSDAFVIGAAIKRFPTAPEPVETLALDH